MATSNVTNGTDNLKGTTGGDDFVVNTPADLQTTDKIDGKAGTDTLLFKNNGGTVTDDQFTGVKSVETIKGDNITLSLVLGELAAKAGVNLVDGVAVTDTLTVDASAFTNTAGISVTGSTSADNHFTGSQFGDRYSITNASLNANAVLDGGAGIDTLTVSDPGVTVADTQFANVDNFEVLAAGASGQKFTLGANAVLAGLSVVDGTGADDNLQINASAFTGHGVTVKGIEADTEVTFTGSAWADLLLVQSTNTASNNFNGAGDVEKTRFGDVIQYVGDGKTAFTVNDSQLADLTDVETLRVGGAPTVAVNLGAESADAGIQFVDGTATTGAFNVDASARLDPITIVSGTGVSNLKGTIDSDTFVFTSKTLLATDVVDGGGLGDKDRIEITDKAALVDAVFAKVSKVEELAFTQSDGPVSDYAGAKVVLGANSAKAGITTVTNETDYGLTVDATTRGTTATVFNGGSADDIFIASTGLTADDTFNAGAGNDSLRIKLAALTDGDVFNGGDGTDEIRILDSLNAKDPTTKLADDDFDGVADVERLVFDATGAQDVTLANEALSSGLEVVDGSKVTGGLHIDASGFADDLQVFLGGGKDFFVAGSNSEVFVQSTKLNGDDTIDAAGGVLHFTDAVKIADKYFQAISGGKITAINEIALDNGAAGQTFVAGNNFEDFTNASGVSVVSASGGSSSSYTFDFTAYNGGTNIDVRGGDGNDVFLGGPSSSTYNGREGDDSFRFSSANLNFGGVDGGDGTDELVVLDAGAGPGAFKIADSFFQALFSIETLRLGASKTGSYEVTLDSDALSEGISKVDASLAGVDVKINAAGLKQDTTYLLSSKVNNIVGGDVFGVSNTFIVDAKTLDKFDTIDGGDGFSTLRFSTGGAISAASLANIESIERIELSDAGNSIVLNPNIIGFPIIASVPLSDGTPSVFALFSVIGGKGSDTVDLSQMGGGGAVLAGGGTDTFIGSSDFDQFIFEHQADLTSADKVDGGGGSDIVIGGAGAWSSDAFKGFKNVEEFSVFDADFSKESTVVLKDAFFASSVTADADGIRTFKVSIDGRMTSGDTIDASLVTSGMNSVVFSFTALFGSGAFGFDENDTLIGGAGWDSVELLSLNNGGTVVLNDTAFAGAHGVEAVRISEDSNGGTTLHLGANAEAAGLQMVDASDADQDLVMDVVGFRDGIQVKLTANDDQVTLNNGDDTITFDDGASLNKDDKIDGNGGNDRIEFLSGQVAAGAFKGVLDADVVALMGETDKMVVDADVIKAGITTIDASQAQQGVQITDSSGGGALTILGSSFGDEITGSSKNDVIYGGLGKDVLKGNGSTDTYVYTNVADSRQGPAGDIEHMDFISDFNAANDKFDFTVVLGANGVLGAAATPGTFTNNDVAGFFKAGATVVAQFDTNFDLSSLGGGTGATRIYVDANNNGNLDLAEDLVVMVKGDQTAGLDVNEFVGVFLDPLRPVLEENNAKVLAGAGTFTDADVAGDNDSLVLTATKGDYKITLGEPATNGFRFIDGSVVGGLLTVDASKHFDPVYIASGKGKNDLTGTAGDDVFYFTSAGLTGDKVNGGPNTVNVSKDDDVIFITDKSALVDAAFANVKNVEILEFGPNPIPGQPQVDVTGQKVVLGLKSEAAGITTVINDWVAGLTVDASARTQGVTFKGGAGADVFITNGDDANAFFGGGGNDSFRSSLANFNDDQQVDGGAGVDEIRILDSDNGKSGVNDSDFNEVDSVERLVFDATGKQFVTLDSSAGEAGIEVVDGSKVSGGLNVTIGNNIDHEVTVIAGTGKDSITLGADGGDILIVSTKLTKDDLLDGGGNGFLHFTDAVKLTDAYFGGIKDVVKNFSGTELDLDNDAKGQSLVAGVNYADFVNNSGMNSVVVKTTQGFTADFTNYLATGGAGNTALLTFIGGEGDDTVTLDKNGLVSVIAQGGDDTVKVGSAAMVAQPIVVNGGDGSDKLVVLDATTLADADFDNVADMEVLVLGASKTGEYHLVSLDTEFTGSGINTIDGSQAGVLVDIDATQLNSDMTLIAGSKINFLSGGAGNDTMVYDTKTFDGADDATGGDSGSGDTLKFSTGGVINTAAFTNGFVFDIEKIAFSDAGNTLIVTAAVVDQIDSTHTDNAIVEFPSGETRTFDFVVQGGKGNDTVDFSAIGNGSSYAMIANGGADKFTGSAGQDFFIFPLAGDLTSADTVKGGADFDTIVILAGTYKADAFKGVSSIETIQVNDATGSTDSSIALSNDFFKGLDLDAEGRRVVTISLDEASTGDGTVDASAVTDATASIHMNAGLGFDTFIGGAGRDVVHFGDDGSNFLLDLEDAVDGRLGWDAIQLEFDTSGLAVDGSMFSHVRNVEELDLIDSTNSGGDVTVALDGDAEESGLQLVDASEVHGNLELDLSVGGFNASLTVKAGGGTKDGITLDDGDDVVWYQNDISVLDKTDGVNGSNGLNTLQFSGDTTLIDEQFSLTASFQKLELRDGAFDVTLDTNADDLTEIAIVDASKAGLNGGLVLDGKAFDDGLSVIGSADADTIETGDDHDLIRGGSGGDSLTGNLGSDTFSYTSSADSFLITGNIETHVDAIQDFSNAVEGDTIDLSAFGFTTGTTDNGVAASLAATTATPAAFFDGSNVLVVQIVADAYVFVDTDKDNNFDFNSDLVIKVVGATASDVENGISFGQ